MNPATGRGQLGRLYRAIVQRALLNRNVPSNQGNLLPRRDCKVTPLHSDGAGRRAEKAKRRDRRGTQKCIRGGIRESH